MSVASMILLGGCGANPAGKNNNQPAINPAATAPEMIAVTADERTLQTNLKEFPSLEASDQPGPVRGVVLTHHELASSMIANLLSRLVKQEKVDTFIIIGPNHPNMGTGWAITTAADWQTPLGTVKSDQQIVADLEKQGSAVEDIEHLRDEHAIYTELPYIKYYFPDAKVVPLALTTFYDLRDADNLAAAIRDEMAGKNIVVLASLDFSHYLSRDQAQANEAVDLQEIKDRDYGSLYKLGNGYIDSSATMIIFLKLMDSLGATNLTVLDHKNSLDFSPDSPQSTTGYYSLLFSR